VHAIRVLIGPLSGIEPELLMHAFRAACTATRVGAAELLIERAPVRVRCLECRHEGERATSTLTCGACGSERTQLLSGDELLLTGIDLEPSDTRAQRRAPAGLNRRN